jgi:hypothetical protein
MGVNKMNEQYKNHELRQANGVMYPFKARPYDDANYYYAVSRDGGKNWIIARDGKRCFLVSGDWKKAVDWLENLNSKIQPKMCHN